jgi:signal transduction histidine kinase
LASLLAAIPILFHVTSLILIKYHYHLLGRLIFSITTPTAVYFIAALLYIDDGTDGMAAKIIIIGSILMPFMVFMEKEWKYTLIVLVLYLSYLISFNYMNDLIVLQKVHNVDTPELRFVSLIITFIMFSSLFFYYKKLITKKNTKLDYNNKALVEKNRELKELNATKNKLFSIIAHDLRSPLHSILGFAEMLQKEHKTLDKEELEIFSEIFYAASKNTCKIVENLLTWSHSQLNSFKVIPTTIDLHRFVSEIIANMKDSAGMKEIKIINLINKNIYVQADNNIAMVVVRNLVSNAIKFSNRNSNITLNAEPLQNENKDFIKICVADSGVGMDYETITKLFKVENTKSSEGTENEQGTGLGLILCKEFTEKNGGTIYVESELGKGSRFYFTLPLAKPGSIKNYNSKKSKSIEYVV